MSQQKPRIGKYGATYPLDGIDRSLFHRLHSAVSRRSRRSRALIFGLPYGRLRTFLVAEFFRQIVEDMGARRYERFLPSVHPEATVELFGFGTYRGRDGYRTALEEWLVSFVDAELRMQRFIQIDRDRVLLLGQLRGGLPGGGSGPLESDLAFALTIERGMAVAGKLFRNKAEALEAVGLSE